MYTVILEINAWLKKCEWGQFIVFELKCYLINANGVIECELKTAKRIITNKIQSNLITNVHVLTNVLTMTECNLCSRKTCRCPVLVRD